MLREHGAQRPTVFEVLVHVHSLRGTKSAYNYPLPSPTPLSPRHSDFKSNPLDGVITYRQPAQPQGSGLQPVAKAQPARPVEPAAPVERRGRPKPSARENSSAPPSAPFKLPTPQLPVEKIKLIDDSGFGADGNAAWSSAVAKNTSMAQGPAASDEAWNIQSAPGLGKTARSSPLSSNTGFNDDFAQKLWASTSSSATKPLLPTPSPRPQTYSSKIGPLPHATLAPSGNIQRTRPELQVRAPAERDAFEGLGLMTPVSKPAPTLGEARKLRTGLAIMSTNINRPIKPSASPRLRPKAHTPRVSPIPPTCPLEPDTNTNAWPSSRPPIDRASSSAETRFPSLEELDATFLASNISSIGTTNKQESKPLQHAPESPSLPPRPAKVGSTGTGSGTGTSASLLKPVLLGHGTDGTRSEQVTGVAMRDTSRDYSRKPQEEDLLLLGKRESERRDNRDSSMSSGPRTSLSRPFFPRENKNALSTIASLSSTAENRPSQQISSSNHPSRSKDLLTGDDEPELPMRQPFDSKLNFDMFKIRESPSKRASVIEQSDILEATIPQQGHAPTPPTKGSPVQSSKTISTATMAESPTVARFMKAFPTIDTAAAARHSSGLTENWSPVATTTSHNTTKEKETMAPKNTAPDSSSSEDEGPEEATALSSIPSKVGSQPRRKGRQSSVHDLVDLWGGGLTATKEKQPESPLPPVPSPFKQNTGATKPKPTYISPPRAASPPRKASPFAPASQNHSSLISENGPSSQSTAGVPPSPSPKSARARPQSMFIFPSRSTDALSQPSATLLPPPEEPRPRSSRRTSISDMVQHYEAIQANARVSGNAVSPSPVSLKPLPSSARDHLQDSGPRSNKPSLDKIAVALPGLGAPSTIVGDPVKRRTSLTVPSTRTALSSQRTSPVSPAVSKVTEKTDADAEVENVPPRTRNISVLRSEPIKLPAVSARKPTLTMEELTKQSQLEPPVSTSNPGADRSPSPERPYQGVGKLIDQWQRKSAEAEASRNAILNKRANLAPPKRAGLVPSANKGS